MFDVVVAGSLHLDIMIVGSPIPAKDETVFGKSWGFKCGGKGGNQAKAAAHVGASTQFVGRVGRDDFGVRLLNDLRSDGVDVLGVSEDAEHGSGMSAALVDDAGNYGASVVSGANMFVSIAADATIDARVLLLQNEIPDSANLAAARAAQRSGAMVVLNGAPWRVPSPPLAAACDLFILNRVEVAQAQGAIDMARQRIIVTFGADGLEVHDRGSVTLIAPHRVRQISSHGAGDMFCGALAARLAKGDTLVSAARFANAAAALHVSRAEGTSFSVSEVQALAGD